MMEAVDERLSLRASNAELIEIGPGAIVTVVVSAINLDYMYTLGRLHTRAGCISCDLESSVHTRLKESLHSCLALQSMRAATAFLASSRRRKMKETKVA